MALSVSNSEMRVFVKIKEIKGLRGGARQYVAQETPQIETEIGKKDHVWMETKEERWKMGLSTFKLMVTAIVISFTFLCSPFAFAQSTSPIPKTMVWSTYDVGSSGYVQASAIADALVKKYGTRIRLLPSGTDVGRLTPLAIKKVSYGFLANEVYFATEGLYSFSSEEWGPQDLRVVAVHPASVAMPTTKESNIRTIQDIKGKRLTYVPGAPSLNVKMDAILAFAGLTWDDVKKIEFPSYSASFRSLLEGRADAAVGSVTSPIMYELDSSPRGLFWVEFPPEEKEAWKRMQKICPFLSPMKEGIGAGLDQKHPRNLIGFKYPMVTVYANEDPETVYNFLKALDECYDLYKNSHPVMPFWRLDYMKPPADAPFHEGAIKYLKEKGVWTAEDEAWNNERIAHMKKLQDAWQKALEEREAKKINSKDFPAYWLEKRKEALAE